MGTNDNNSDLFDLDDDNSSQSLEDIIADDNKTKNDEDAIINRDRKKDLTKKVSVIGGSALVVCLVVGGLFFINPFGGDQNVGENDKKMTSIDDEKTKKIAVKDKDVNTDDDFYHEDGKYFPTKVEKWQKKPYEEQKDSELKKDIIKTGSTTSLGSSANILPSENSGYTSDDSKVEVDGGLNPYYSYWTAEVFTSEAGEHIERLLNPTFGDWSRVQYSSYPGNKNLEFDSKIKDMFTNNWVNKNKDKKYSEYVPILADWKGNDYGMGDKLLSSGPRWYGEITDSTYDFKFSEDTQQYTVDVKSDVKFIAWSKDQSKLEKTGTLTLTFVSNEDGKNDSGYKVLINKASLKVD